MNLPRALLVFWLVLGTARGEIRTLSQFAHKSWVGRDGAPASIYAITQTTDGYLWLASSQGLYRFDGIEFENFKPAGQQLPAPFANSLLSCPNGDLWIGFRGSGISLLRKGILHSYTARDGFPGGTVSSIAQDHHGAIWAATQGGLARFQNGTWSKAVAQSGFEGTPIQAYVDQHGTLWVSTENNLFFLPEAAKSFQRLGPPIFWALDIKEASNGRLWMAETNNAVRPVPFSSPVPLSRKGPQIRVGSRALLFDHDGSLWITTLGDGLRRIQTPERLPNEQINEFDNQAESLTAKDGLSGDYVLSIYQDREGSVWVGTAKGLDRFTRSPVVPSTVPDKFSYSILAPGANGDVWVGCTSFEVGQVHNDHWASKEKFTAFSAVADPRGGTWWSTYASGFREIDGHFTKVFFPLSYRGNAQMNSIALDSAGSLWLSGTPGIFVQRDGRWTSVQIPAALSHKYVNVSFGDPLGRLWFGYSENSILLVEGSHERLFTPHDGLQVGLVQAIAARGPLAWIAGSSGLQLFDGRRFRTIYPQDGSTFGSISGVLETADGELWLNSNRGVVQIRRASVAALKKGASKTSYSIFDSYDGLPGATQQLRPFPTMIQATDGKIWFGTTAGPAWIDPNNIPRNELPPPVTIRSVSSNGQMLLPSGKLQLSEPTRDLQINYTALSFAVPERVRFRIKLDGADGKWHDAGTRRTAYYMNLAPGNYRFNVIACNNDGVWNEIGATVPFTVQAAWFQTNWFRACCLAVALLLVWISYRYRVMSLEKRFAFALQTRLNERMRIARDLHDTLLQSFQALMLHLQVVDDLLPNGTAKEHLERTLERGDRAIAEARKAVTELRSSQPVAEHLVQTLRELGNDLVKQNTITFALVTEGLQRELHPIVRDELCRIAHEAMRNAVSHAQAEHMEVEISYSEKTFHLRIRDDGIGIPGEVLQNGLPGHYGLAGMRERAEQIGAKLVIWSGARNGTEIDVMTPGSIAYRSGPKRGISRFFRRLKEEDRAS